MYSGDFHKRGLQPLNIGSEVCAESHYEECHNPIRQMAPPRVQPVKAHSGSPTSGEHQGKF